MTVPAQVLAAVRSIPHPRQEPDMTAVDKTTASDAEFQRMLDRFEAAPEPPESDNADLWAKLSDLIPCNDFVGCGDECECAEGELRLAVQRLIVAERVHHADCGDDEDCCNATAQRARLVNKAAALTGDRLRARRTALRGQPQPPDTQSANVNR